MISSIKRDERSASQGRPPRRVVGDAVGESDADEVEAEAAAVAVGVSSISVLAFFGGRRRAG